jgi:uncharacterized protein
MKHLKTINPVSIFKGLLLIQDEPTIIAKGFALGSFIGMLPIPGFQVLVSLSIATLFKLNKKAACIAVFNTNIATGGFVFSFNYWVGKKILGVNPTFVMDETFDFKFISIIVKAGSDVFFSLFAGGILTGILTAVIVYYLLLKLLIVRKPAGQFPLAEAKGNAGRRNPSTQYNVLEGVFPLDLSDGSSEQIGGRL